jgi:hypothetical protein
LEQVVTVRVEQTQRIHRTAFARFGQARADYVMWPIHKSDDTLFIESKDFGRAVDARLERNAQRSIDAHP